MSTVTLEADLELAQRLADEAREISLGMFRGSFGQRRKADGSIVTDADEAVERKIRETLARLRPADAILGEEQGQTGSGNRRWIVDAIDGTHSFATGSSQWGTLIALEIDSELAVGVCDMAPIDRRYWAASGAGAWSRDGTDAAVRLCVSGSDSLAASRCFVPGPEWLPANDREPSHALVRATRAVTPDDHPALRVAAGELELAAFFMGGPWDVAAPAVVVIEAGGRFTDLAGGTRTDLGGGLFSNGAVHDAALALVRRK